MTSLKNTKGLFLSFLIGGTIGSIIALLYAPKAGRYLRSDINKKTNDLIEAGKNKSAGIWNDTKDKTESTLGSANDFLNSGMEKIIRKTEKVKDSIKSGSKFESAMKEDLENSLNQIH
jgi:gas vesicle protein